MFTKARHWTQVKSDSIIALKVLTFVKLNISSFGTQNFTGASNVLTQIHALNVGILMDRKGGRREKTRKKYGPYQRKWCRENVRIQNGPFIGHGRQVLRSKAQSFLENRTCTEMAGQGEVTVLNTAALCYLEMLVFADKTTWHHRPEDKQKFTRRYNW